jgi:hypothetical protein
MTPNPSLKRRPATAATVWPLQAKADIVLAWPAGICLRGRLSSNVRPQMRTPLALLALLQILNAANAGPKVDPIAEQKLENCGCVFRVPASSGANGRTIAQWDGVNWDGKAKMSIDGQAELLDVQNLPASRKPSDRLKVGMVTKYRLSNSRAQVDILARITQVCPKSQETCEETQYAATFAVRTSEGTSKFRAWAACGC